MGGAGRRDALNNPWTLTPGRECAREQGGEAVKRWCGTWGRRLGAGDEPGTGGVGGGVDDACVE